MPFQTRSDLTWSLGALTAKAFPVTWEAEEPSAEDFPSPESGLHKDLPQWGREEGPAEDCWSRVDRSEGKSPDPPGWVGFCPETIPWEKEI